MSEVREVFLQLEVPHRNTHTEMMLHRLRMQAYRDLKDKYGDVKVITIDSSGHFRTEETVFINFNITFTNRKRRA